MIVRILALMGLLALPAQAEECITHEQAVAVLAAQDEVLAKLPDDMAAAVQKDFAKQTGSDEQMDEIDAVIPHDREQPVFLVLFKGGCVLVTGHVSQPAWEAMVGQGA